MPTLELTVGAYRRFLVAFAIGFALAVSARASARASTRASARVSGSATPVGAHPRLSALR